MKISDHFDISEHEPKRITIKLKNWDRTCGDRCCYDYGTDIYINDELLDGDGYHKEAAIAAILDYLGYQVIFENED